MSIDFEKSQRLATDLLAKQQLSSAKVNVLSLKYDKKIMFCSVQEYATIVKTPIAKFYQGGKLIDGCTIIKPGEDCIIVLYNNNLSKTRLNWTLAHEIGHIYLEHREDTSETEAEAHFFAGQLLTPMYVLSQIKYRIGVVNDKDLSCIFNVSSAAARRRIEDLKIQKSSICVCDCKDSLVWNMMKNDILQHYSRLYGQRAKRNARALNALKYYYNRQIDDIKMSDNKLLYNFCING